MTSPPLADGGWGGAIGNNFLATVQHNGVLNPTFTGTAIGSVNAIRYYGIEYRYADEFLHTSDVDYKITRLSKILTDVSGSAVYGSADGNYSSVTDGSLVGELIYRAGAGAMYKADHNGTLTKLTGGYITGGIDTIDQIGGIAADSSSSTFTYINWKSEGINESSKAADFPEWDNESGNRVGRTTRKAPGHAVAQPGASLMVRAVTNSVSWPPESGHPLQPLFLAPGRE